MPEKKDIIISTDLAQATVNYLATRPYQEVFQLIASYQQAVQLKPEAPEEKKEEDEA